MLAPVGTPAVVLPMDAQKAWVFKTTQNDDLISEALVAHMAKKGVKTVGFIGFNDAYGESWYRTFVPMAEKAGIKVVANERYARSDQSVVGQATKIIAAAPDAVLVGAAGGGTVLPHTTLVERGYKGQIYQTHGAATPDFVRLGGKNVEGAVMAASLMLVIDQVPDSNPAKKVALDYIAAYEKAYPGNPVLDLRRQRLRRRPAAAEGGAAGGRQGQARHAGVPLGAARCARADQGARRHAGRLHDDRCRPLRVRQARARADAAEGREVGADPGVTLARSLSRAGAAQSRRAKWCCPTHCATWVPSATPASVEKPKCMPPTTRAIRLSSSSALVLA